MIKLLLPGTAAGGSGAQVSIAAPWRTKLIGLRGRIQAGFGYGREPKSFVLTVAGYEKDLADGPYKQYDRRGSPADVRQLRQRYLLPKPYVLLYPHKRVSRS